MILFSDGHGGRHVWGFYASGEVDTRIQSVLQVQSSTPYQLIKRCNPPILNNEKTAKAPVTPNGDATAFVQRSKTMSARRGIAAKYA